MFEYTNRVGNKCTTTFGIDEWFDHMIANPNKALFVQGDETTIAGHFKITNYQIAAQLRESPEYHAQADAYAEAHGIDVKLLEKKDVQSSRPTGAITKADRETLGERVIVNLEELLPEGDEGEASAEWAKENLASVFANAKDQAWMPSTRPIPPEKPTTASAKKQAEERVEKLEAKLRAMGIDPDAEEEIQESAV